MPTPGCLPAGPLRPYADVPVSMVFDSGAGVYFVPFLRAINGMAHVPVPERIGLESVVPDVDQIRNHYRDIPPDARRDPFIGPEISTMAKVHFRDDWMADHGDLKAGMEELNATLRKEVAVLCVCGTAETLFFHFFRQYTAMLAGLPPGQLKVAAKLEIEGGLHAATIASLCFAGHSGQRPLRIRDEAGNVPKHTKASFVTAAMADFFEHGTEGVRARLSGQI